MIENPYIKKTRPAGKLPVNNRGDRWSNLQGDI